MQAMHRRLVVTTPPDARGERRRKGAVRPRARDGRSSSKGTRAGGFSTGDNNVSATWSFYFGYGHRRHVIKSTTGSWVYALCGLAGQKGVEAHVTKASANCKSCAKVAARAAETTE